MEPSQSSSTTPTAGDGNDTADASNRQTAYAAATRIQSRFRGYYTRTQHQRVVVGITKLQARQRGRYSRRAFAQLLSFAREQEHSLAAAKRRHFRIARHEQELYFLQHTTAVTLAHIRAFQQQRGARTIQRAWRQCSQSSGTSTSASVVATRCPRDLILAFDPFDIIPPGHDAQTTDTVLADSLSHHQLDLELERDLLAPRTHLSAHSTALDSEDFAQRRSDIYDRIKQRVQMQKTQRLSVSNSSQRVHCSSRDTHHGRAQTSSSSAAAASRAADGPSLPSLPTGTSLSPTKPLNRRRELYDQVRQLQAATARRVAEIERSYRVTRSARELLSAKLASSCEHRLQVLQQDLAAARLPFGDHHNSTTHNNDDGDGDDDTPLESVAPDALSAQTASFRAETDQWSAERKVRAWHHHSQLVHAALRTPKWWLTSIAGRECDIRRVHAVSPWEHERQVWLWPRDASSTVTAAAVTQPGECTTSKSKEKTDEAPLLHASEIDTFVFSLSATASRARAETSSAASLQSVRDNQVTDGSQRPEPMDDGTASEWWRAHCMQQHVSNSKAAALDKTANQDNNHDRNNDGTCSRWSAEMLANPVLYRLVRESERRARARDLDAAASSMTDHFAKHVAQRVCEVETQLDVNTAAQLDLAQRRQHIAQRRTREERAAVDLQRVVRGAQGRKRAQAVRAEFFVLVRGRAIRKGKCEECGEQPAVLECRECEESLHFCPTCWVHVHATRRRRAHCAIPMSVVPAPTAPAAALAAVVAARPAMPGETTAPAAVTTARTAAAPAQSSTTRVTQGPAGSLGLRTRRDANDAATKSHVHCQHATSGSLAPAATVSALAPLASSSVLSPSSSKAGVPVREERSKATSTVDEPASSRVMVNDATAAPADALAPSDPSGSVSVLPMANERLASGNDESSSPVAAVDAEVATETTTRATDGPSRTARPATTLSERSTKAAKQAAPLRPQSATRAPSHRSLTTAAATAATDVVVAATEATAAPTATDQQPSLAPQVSDNSSTTRLKQSDAHSEPTSSMSAKGEESDQTNASERKQTQPPALGQSATSEATEAHADSTDTNASASVDEATSIADHLAVPDIQASGLGESLVS